MKLQLVASGSTLALTLSILAFSVTEAHAQQAASADTTRQDARLPSSAEDTVASAANVIVVSGVRQSIEGAIDDKRISNEIMDSISAEDIGQLANDNVAEALQRIPGLQVDRSNDGEGKQVQVRGLTENNITINGAIATGTGDVDLSNENDRGVNFQDLPAELFSGVTVQKSASADQIEGSLGGTIDLKTRAPLTGKRDFIVNVSGTETYRPVGESKEPSANLFLQKKFRDTSIGDVGIILNFGYKRISSLAAVYGAGEYGGAPGVWERLSGANPLPASAGSDQSNGNYNFFSLSQVQGQANPYQYAPVDVNGDQAANASDVVYVPNAFGESLRSRDDTRRTFNGTLEWKPASNLDVRFDTVLTGLDQNMTGANFNIVSSVPRAGFLIGGPGNTFEELANTPDMGPVYVMTGGRLASFTTRVGAQPSINQTFRKSQQYSLETTWDVTSRLSLFAEGTTSRGKASTGNFGQLNAGIEDQGGNAAIFNNQDFYQIVDYSLANNLIPNVTLYQDPFPSPGYGVSNLTPTGSLVALNPGDLSYQRYRYYQYQRNAADTNNKDDSVRFDLNWDAGNGFLKSIKAGIRWADRGFQRRSYVNQNQNGNLPYVMGDPASDPIKGVNIQRIPLDPANTTDVGAIATSQFMQSCLTTASTMGLLNQFGGNLPGTFGSTAGCNIAALQDYFNLIDIRAIDPTTGAGYYENKTERFSVGEDTLGAYLEGDFRTRIGSVNMYGNVGLRYVRTRTNSTGYLPGPTKPTTYNLVTFQNRYDDWLPSANVNFGLTDNLIFRLAYSRTLGRPELTQISPGLNLAYSSTDPNYAGSGIAGNPYLQPIHSNNLDGSLEWYYDKGGYVSVAVFQKNIDSTIFLNPTPSDLNINGQLFSVQTYSNFGGTKIRGVEFGFSHAFNYLPGMLKNLGLTGNLTVIGEDSALRDQEGDPISRKGLSKLTYNLSGYYDDGRFSVRMAYNWRSKFTRVEAVSLGYNRPEALPEIEAARGQLDFSARFKVNRYVRFSFNAINLTNTGTYRYLKYPVLVNYLSRSGRAYSLSAALSF